MILDDCGLCIQMGNGLEKLYYIKNKTQSKIVVEVDLTDPSFPKKEIEFRYGDIRQFLVMKESIYTVNCHGVFQVYSLKTGLFKDAVISQGDSLLIDNFAVSHNESYLAISGSESRISQKSRQVIIILDLISLKKYSMAVLKDSSEGEGKGTVKKTLFYEMMGKLMLIAITDGNCGVYVYEVKEKEMTTVCYKEFYHLSKSLLFQNTFTILWEKIPLLQHAAMTAQYRNYH